MAPPIKDANVYAFVQRMTIGNHQILTSYIVHPKLGSVKTVFEVVFRPSVSYLGKQFHGSHHTIIK